MEISANRLNGALERGSVTTLFDQRDLPIELQILDSLINREESYEQSTVYRRTLTYF